MSLLASQLVAILPWVSGIFFLYLLMPKYFRAGYGFRYIMIGAAFFVGYFALAAQIWLLDQLNLKVFSPNLLVTTGTIFFICILIKSLSKETAVNVLGEATEPSFNAVSAVSLIFCVVIIVFAFHEHFLWPAVAWDTVEYWAIEANEFIERDKLNTKVAPFTSFGPHPKTLIYLMAWGGWSASIGDPSRLAPLIPWLHLYVAIAVSILGFFLWKTRSLTISMVFTYMFLSSPLAEAHAILGGYADLWLAFAIFLSIIFFSQYQDIRDNKLLALALITGVIPIFIKGIGSVYSFSLLTVFLFTLVISKWGRSAIFSFFGLLFLIIFSLNIINIDITVLGERFAILSSEDIAILGGREMYFTNNEWYIIFYNIYIALFVKNSFGILFSIATISYIYLISLMIFKKKVELFPHVGLFTLISCIIIAALRYTDYFFLHSHPGNDTSLSRVYLTLFLLGFTIIATAINELSKLDE